MTKRKNRNVKKLLSILLTATAVGSSMFTASSCHDGETYAEMKEKEAKAISSFLSNNPFVGQINPITEEQFAAQGYTTDVSSNQFVLFNSDGIYMQIVRQPEGQTLVDMAMERSDSTITKPISCRFLEYDIENADTTYTNLYTTSIAQGMQCTYSHYGRSFTASFTSEGRMYAAYGSVVPKGWLKPLTYIHLTKKDGEQARVRLIVPHSSGTTNASGYVLPFYYEITYLLPPNS